MLKALQNNWLTVVLIIIGTFILFRAPNDPDFGWHYKYGEYFIQNRSLLKENIFSFTYPDYHWVNTYWGFEAYIYLTHKYLGHVTPTIILAFIMSCILYKGIKMLTTNLIVSSGIYIAMISNLSIYALTIRPHYFSTLFMYILLWLLLYSKKNIKYTPILFLLWTNIHADFTLGLFVLGVYTLWITYLNSIPLGKKPLWYLFGTLIKTSRYLVLSTLVTIANPNGINLWITLLKELTLPIKSYVVEWTAFRVSDPLALGFLGFIYAMFLIGGLGGRKRYGTWYAILVVFFFIFSIKASYMARVFFIISSFGLAISMDAFFTQLFNFLGDKNYKIIKVYSTSFVLILTLSLTANFCISVYRTLHTNLWTVNAKYPYDAIEYIKNNPIEGNVLNHYNWGGYMIWQLPEYKTFIDGRMTSWREDNKYFMEDYYKISKEPTKNTNLVHEYINKYNITWALEEPDNELAKYLREMGWRVAFENDYSIILQK